MVGYRVGLGVADDIAGRSRSSSVLMTLRCARGPDDSAGAGTGPQRGTKVRSKCGLAMLSPLFGMTDIGADLQV